MATKSKTTREAAMSPKSYNHDEQGERIAVRWNLLPKVYKCPSSPQWPVHLEVPQCITQNQGTFAGEIAVVLVANKCLLIPYVPLGQWGSSQRNGCYECGAPRGRYKANRMTS
ncbi:hypothetical protein Tco_0526020 [Tanacetum coccineum]